MGMGLDLTNFRWKLIQFCTFWKLLERAVIWILPCCLPVQLLIYGEHHQFIWLLVALWIMLESTIWTVYWKYIGPFYQCIQHFLPFLYSTSRPHQLDEKDERLF